MREEDNAAQDRGKKTNVSLSSGSTVYDIGLESGESDWFRREVQRSSTAVGR